MKGVILLDRDGVLNELCVDEEHGVIDSPLNVNQVKVYPWVGKALKRLTDAGYLLSIVTNQPAAEKKKTTMNHLNSVMSLVVSEAQKDGAKISSVKICTHTKEAKCECRKPKPKMLLDVLAELKASKGGDHWMVGDGITDIQAGHSAGVKTAFLFPHKIEYEKVFAEKGVKLPNLWCENLDMFVSTVLNK